VFKGDITMSVLITGGNGHVSSWIAYMLAKKGREVISFDANPNPPLILDTVRDNIDFVMGDVLDFALLTDVVNQHRDSMEGIIHTAALMHTDLTANPHRNLSINWNSLLNVLELTRIFEIPKVVYTSTGGVYGGAEGVVHEELNPAKPEDLYSVTKYSGEMLGAQYQSEFGVDFRVARIFFVYGPDRLPSRFFPFYKACFGPLEGLKGISLEKGGDQRLDFTYVEDAARGILMLLDAENLDHKVFNISSGTGISLFEVLELSRKHSSLESDIHMGPGQFTNRPEALDNTLAKDEFGYQAMYSIEDGVKAYAKWFNNNNI
jgi:nucleoside-diphosphate-sugar epimerase